jgi:glycosyltransferase involved in cell wall biosynthesis
MSNKPTVSVIIPVLNAEKYIKECLNAIFRLNSLNGEFEVILMDNGSSDRTLEKAKDFVNKIDLKIFIKPKVNISALRNYGANNSRGEILAFLDIDCIVEKEWLNKGILPINSELLIKDEVKDKVVGMSGSAYRIPPNSSWLANAWSLNASNQPVTGMVKWLPGGNMFIRKDVFFSLGGFDELLSTNEDYDLSYRLRERGYVIFSDKRIEVLHLGTPQTLKEFFKKELWHGKDVFKVFLNSGRKLRNFKAVSFALFYLISLIGMILSSFYALNNKYYTYLILFIFMLIMPPIILSLKKMFEERLFSNIIIALAFLYLVYGIARAFCILNFNWLKDGN